MNFPIIDPVATGTNIKKMLKDKGLSVVKVKELLGISDKSNLYKWFRGEALPTIDNLLALSMLLGVTVNDLIVTEKAA